MMKIFSILFVFLLVNSCHYAESHHDLTYKLGNLILSDQKSEIGLGKIINNDTVMFSDFCFESTPLKGIRIVDNESDTLLIFDNLATNINVLEPDFDTADFSYFKSQDYDSVYDLWDSHLLENVRILDSSIYDPNAKLAPNPSIWRFVNNLSYDYLAMTPALHNRAFDKAIIGVSRYTPKFYCQSIVLFEKSQKADWKIKRKNTSVIKFFSNDQFKVGVKYINNYDE